MANMRSIWDECLEYKIDWLLIDKYTLIHKILNVRLLNHTYCEYYIVKFGDLGKETMPIYKYINLQHQVELLKLYIEIYGKKR